ncbi:MAG: aminoacyl-tRNA hydrolase [Clostridiales bacterium]|nr:aminoacyl-tRNA hydrolase [Clostridiales bacterium]MCF8021571.1 aminoacyl-tRNA hydrolase [Clostridiales bacterium]
MKIIVGLGNPGERYVNTRHNVGFWVVQKLANNLNTETKKSFLKSKTGQAFTVGEKIVFAKPQTYMNASGESVQLLVNWYKISLDDLIVIYDDMDLPPGSMRIRTKGGSGGHRGMESIIKSIGSKQFPRLRIGIGKPPQSWENNINWVLGKFEQGEKEEVLRAVKEASDALEVMIQKGINPAMNLYNK